VTDYVEMALLFVGWPLLAGASFATVAGLLRRRYGPWALLALTVATTVSGGDVGQASRARLAPYSCSPPFLPF